VEGEHRRAEQYGLDEAHGDEGQIERYERGKQQGQAGAVPEEVHRDRGPGVRVAAV